MNIFSWMLQTKSSRFSPWFISETQTSSTNVQVPMYQCASATSKEISGGLSNPSVDRGWGSFPGTTLSITYNVLLPYQRFLMKQVVPH